MHGLKSIRFGSIDGVEVKLDWSVLVIFWLLIWSLGRLRSVPPARRATTRISEIAWPVEDLTIAAPDELILGVLGRGATVESSRAAMTRWSASCRPPT